MFSVTKRFEFEACHKLNLTYDSPCQKLHGHSYKVMIEVSTDKLDENGMVIDFTKLKSIKDWVMENWDHAMIVAKGDPDTTAILKLNIAKVFEIEEKNVTAENMAKILEKLTHDKIKDDINHHNLKNIKIKIWETSSNMAKYSKDY